jgi:hypothetical protein
MLRPGEVVEVRSLAEILATLDADASLDAMPFMPEMMQFAGKRFTVSHRVEKICDTVKDSGPPQSRRMRDTVLLDDLRCDGSGHDGCQAGCRIYWKESWLRRVDPDSEPAVQTRDPLAELEELTRKAARAVTDPEIYRCQATEASRASEPMSNFDLRQYGRELTANKVGIVRLLRVALRAVVGMVGRRLRVVSFIPLRPSPIMERLPLGRRAAPAPAPAQLNLQPGDWVEVRSPDEIAPTLNASGKTRGLTFDQEMLMQCGRRYRVQDRVERIIDERNGRMIDISSDCLILEGSVCSGEHSVGHWFCPRAIYPYWREAWLRPMDGADAPAAAGESHGSH